MKLIIGLVGEKLAGKDTVAEYIVKKHGAAHFRTSDILEDLLNILGLPITRRNEIDVGKAMEQTFGDKIIGQALLSRLKKSSATLVINNGLRQEYQFDEAKAMGAKIIYVTAPAELRYARMVKRHQKIDDSGQSFEEFLKQDKEWIEEAIPKLGKRADFKIENVGSLEELYKKVDDIMSQPKA